MREVLSSTCTCACVCAAEEELGRAKVQPQCILTVLQILTHEGVDIAIRQAASVFFKNLVKAHWAPEDETAYTIPADTKTQVKDGLLSLFLFVPPKLQAQLSEAMSLIATPPVTPATTTVRWVQGHAVSGDRFLITQLGR